MFLEEALQDDKLIKSDQTTQNFIPKKIPQLNATTKADTEIGIC